MSQNKIFMPHELKTIEIDIENKIFRVNGEDFGKHCTYFSINCCSDRSYEEWFNVSMDVNSGIRFQSKYDFGGKKTSEKSIEKE